MRKTVMYITAAGCIIISFVVVKGNLHRWDNEPGQVIACIICMILLSGIVMALTYFMTMKNKDNVQRDSWKSDKYGKKRRF